MYLRVNFEVRSGYGGPFLSIPVSKRTPGTGPLESVSRGPVLQKNPNDL